MTRHPSSSLFALTSKLHISALAGLLAFGLSGWAPDAAGEMLRSADGKAHFEPGQSISYAFGSKFMSGYFTQEGSRCYATLLVIERFDPEAGQEVSPVSAVRIRLVLGSGEMAGLDSEEKRSLNLTCAEQGKVLTVEAGPRAALVAQQRESLAREVALSPRN